MNFAKLLRTTFYIPPVAASVKVATYFDLSAKRCAVFEDLLVFTRNTVMPDFEFLSIVLESYFLIISIFFITTLWIRFFRKLLSLYIVTDRNETLHAYIDTYIVNIGVVTLISN